MAKGEHDFDYASVEVPPGAIFIEADEPLLVYPSVAAAERHLEAEDVTDGVYPAAYGPNGEPYRVRSDGRHVIIEPTGEPERAGELRLLRLQYLEAIGRNPDANSTNNDLVATVWVIERDVWRKHGPYGDRCGTRVPPWGCIGLLLLVAAGFYLAFR
ncbi:hypothetical protein [Sphingomonas baiyangensis]|uniref:Uncharacterized protein n=1 Tax=Sphingomonas baiyangensis TaxID=2572576 RepID=A0A4U1L9U4_9SPHN|nr:hypothetical protein [Sphingomonas baiyangensis]TKD53225.1 hypothetical protein FBR43_02545 [Sphingomonas baiyangensis]